MNHFFKIQVHIKFLCKYINATMNIFGSKIGHLKNNKKCNVFFISPQFVAKFDNLSEFCCIFGTLHFEKSSNIENNFFGKNEEKSSNYFITWMVAFGAKNVHSAMWWIWKVIVIFKKVYEPQDSTAWKFKSIFFFYEDFTSCVRTELLFFVSSNSSSNPVPTLQLFLA